MILFQILISVQETIPIPTHSSVYSFITSSNFSLKCNFSLDLRLNNHDQFMTVLKVFSEQCRWGASGHVLTPSMPAVPNCCCLTGLAPYWSNPRNYPPSLIFDIQTLWHSVLSTTVPECQKLKAVC